jgi:ribonucleoside-diphosphate reductase alpha chain/ribonucleoside-triphosphate reductase
MQEAIQSLDDMFYLRQLPSGRTMWVGGTDIIDMIPTANYNCSFTAVDSIESFHDMFYLLMVGCGVGFSTEWEHVKKLPLFNKNIELVVQPYNWNQSYADETIVQDEMFNPTAKVIYVGDSREGWAKGVQKFFELLAEKTVTKITVNVDSIRPQGERLKRFGGKSSGPESYVDMLKLIHQVIVEAPEEPFIGPDELDINRRITGWDTLTRKQHEEIYGGMARLRPIDVLDISNIIGKNVVAGGVRRTAQIALFDAEDDQMLHAKDEFWADPRTQHRNMSNNSIMFWGKPKRSYLNKLVDSIKNSYEPGFINAQAAAKRRPNFAGVNPCAEILLANRGFCNLATVFMTTAITGGMLDVGMLKRLVRQATRHCMRITNVDIELPKWDAVQKRDRLLGVNLTGIEDAFDAATAGGRMVHTVDEDGNIKTVHADQLLADLREAANEEADTYSVEMGIPRPLLVTTVQPSGTLSQLVACSSGFHRSFAPYFIRRVRINSFDALARTVRQQGYKVYPEFGKGWTKLPAEFHDHVFKVTGNDNLYTMTSKHFDMLDDYTKDMILDLADTWVVEFVVKTAAKSKAADESAIDQFDRYLAAQKNWTDHNTSATIQVGDDEWLPLFKKLHDNWDDYIGVSFQNKSNDKYDLAPYEAIEEDEYNERIAGQQAIDIALLNAIENGSNSADDDLDAACATGACPVR